jgi:hypothetical protein
MITDYIIQVSRTEDGDYVYVRIVCCDSLKEAREMTAVLLEQKYLNIRWKCRGSKFIFRGPEYMVDQVEVAIERNNDYVAWMRADPREDELMRLGY